MHNITRSDINRNLNIFLHEDKSYDNMWTFFTKLEKNPILKKQMQNEKSITLAHICLAQMHYCNAFYCPDANEENTDDTCVLALDVSKSASTYVLQKMTENDLVSIEHELEQMLLSASNKDEL